MSKPHKCPVCDGTGQVFTNPARYGGEAETCHVCKGACVLWEPDSAAADLRTEPRVVDIFPTQFTSETYNGGLR